MNLQPSLTRASPTFGAWISHMSCTTFGAERPVPPRLRRRRWCRSLYAAAARPRPGLAAGPRRRPARRCAGLARAARRRPAARRCVPGAPARRGRRVDPRGPTVRAARATRWRIDELTSPRERAPARQLVARRRRRAHRAASALGARRSTADAASAARAAGRARRASLRPRASGLAFGILARAAAAHQPGSRLYAPRASTGRATRHRRRARRDPRPAWRCVADVRPRRDRDRARVLRVRLRACSTRWSGSDAGSRCVRPRRVARSCSSTSSTRCSGGSGSR